MNFLQPLRKAQMSLPAETLLRIVIPGEVEELYVNRKTLFARVQSSSYFVRRQPGYAYHFLPAAFAGRNSNGRARHLQKFRKEFGTGLVGLAFNWRRCNRKLQRVSQLSKNGCLLGARVNLDRESNASNTLLNGDHFLRAPEGHGGNHFCASVVIFSPRK